MKDRKFKVWHYTVSHSQLLIRSVGNDKNIDIYFGNLKYMELPSILDGVLISEATAEDFEYLKKKVDCVKSKVTVLVSSNRKYYVVSDIVKVMENNLDMFELPFDN